MVFDAPSHHSIHENQGTLFVELLDAQRKARGKTARVTVKLAPQRLRQLHTVKVKYR